MAGSPDYVGTGRGNPSSSRIEGIGGQNLYAHKTDVAVEIVLNSSCMGGRQPMPAETHVAPDEYIRITKQMRRRQCRADAIQVAGRGGGGMYYW
ncbi:MAG: hypothetical protein C5S49_01635 [Candidatus Methanogaster sp.]|nr:MAG: hypothetical protein C5S49_01635 [ANME-2 cluster archaeon]